MDYEDIIEAKGAGKMREAAERIKIFAEELKKVQEQGPSTTLMWCPQCKVWVIPDRINLPFPSCPDCRTATLAMELQ